ncbi:hypothetical protein ACOBQX_18255 [Actinokineospora sp. G85]|uniref:hypothetical protein n=1 Tax=Actinokineospora sp. G85 TaxID=3406626 RepID=UPI003C78DF26
MGSTVSASAGPDTTELGTITVPAPSFAEYAAADRRGRNGIVVDQHARQADAEHYAHVFYRPITDAITTSLTAPDPTAALTAATESAELNGQARAFEEVAAGFSRWWKAARATPVPVGESILRFGSLAVAVRPHLGFRDRAGVEHAVLLHLKEAPLARDAANAALRMLDRCMLDLLPGAVPLVVDVRRAKQYRLSRSVNVELLDAWLAAQASAYVTHWCRTD